MLGCKVSMHLGKKYSIKHNLRNYKDWNKDGHINPDRTPLNEVLFNKDLRDFFYDVFSEAILAYNDKNKSKHPERVTTVKDYFNKNKKAVQEAIFQMGDHETYNKIVDEIGQEKADDFYKTGLVELFENWKKDNPSLRVFHASIHMDEVENGTPHLHIDFIPVAESNRGLTTKVSLDGALKPLGFLRDKKDKYDNTPYKQWIKSYRKKTEDFFQKFSDDNLGKAVIKILPSEHSSKPHQEPWEHRAEQKGLKAAKAFLMGEGKAKIKAAEEIIDNAEAITKAIKADAKRDKATADKRLGEAVRKERAAEKKMQEADERETQTKLSEAELSQKKSSFKRQYREKVNQLKCATAKAIIKIEQEVQRRLAPTTFPMRQQEEDERYLHRRRTSFAVELEQSQDQGKVEQNQTQKLFEKVKHKSTKRKGDFER